MTIIMLGGVPLAASGCDNGERISRLEKQTVELKTEGGRLARRTTMISKQSVRGRLDLKRARISGEGFWLQLGRSSVSYL